MACSTGVLVPPKGYLKRLAAICAKHDILLIFDEVITGFRLAPGGARERYGVRPDLSCYGKALGNGMPIAAIGGTAAGAANIIAFNRNAGVRVFDDLGPLSRSIAILSNSIFSMRSPLR